MFFDVSLTPGVQIQQEAQMRLRELSEETDLGKAFLVVKQPKNKYNTNDYYQHLPTSVRS